MRYAPPTNAERSWKANYGSIIVINDSIVAFLTRRFSSYQRKFIIASISQLQNNFFAFECSFDKMIVTLLSAKISHVLCKVFFRFCLYDQNSRSRTILTVVFVVTVII